MTSSCLLCLKIISWHFQVRFHFELIRTWILLFLIFSFLLHFNVVFPSEGKLTVATCNWTRAITQIQTTRDGVNGATLPCVWLAHATSGDSVAKQPHLSPQHCELNDRQHVLDRTRVSVSKRCSKGMKKQQAWGKSLRRHHRTTQEWPFVYYAGIHDQPRLQREGGREN